MNLEDKSWVINLNNKQAGARSPKYLRIVPGVISRCVGITSPIRVANERVNAE